MSDTRPSHWRSLLLAALLLTGLLLLGSYLEGVDSLQPLRSSLQTQYAHRSSFPGNRTLRFLNRLGALHPAPPAAVSPIERQVTQRRPDDRVFAFWGTGTGDPSKLPSTRKAPPELTRSGLPVLSISIKKGDLRELLKDPRARGRRTEKQVFVSFFDGGELIFGSGAGIRLHGETTRTGAPKKSYRLFLRDTYGETRFPRTIVRDPSAYPLRRLVLDSDLRHFRDGSAARFSDPLAYDFARQAGALTPSTRPLQVVINGQPQGLYVAIEYLDRNYIKGRYEHDRFTFVRTASGAPARVFEFGDFRHYRQLLDFARSDAVGLDSVAKVVDLENLSRWFVTMLICGTLDAMEGALLFDETDVTGRWFWINWDMDSSFGLAYRIRQQTPSDVDVFTRIVFRSGRDTRSRILRRLIRSSPEYRTYLLGLYAEIVNHRVTEAFIDEKLDSYKRLALRHGISDIGFIERYRDFLSLRAPVLRRRLAQQLGAGKSHSVRVGLPAGRRIKIDGFIKQERYSGWYFGGMTLELVVAEESIADFRYWQIGSERREEPELLLEIDSPLEVEAVFVESLPGTAR